MKDITVDKAQLEQWFIDGLDRGYNYMVLTSENGKLYPVYEHSSGYGADDKLVRKYKNRILSLFGDMDEEILRFLKGKAAVAKEEKRKMALTFDAMDTRGLHRFINVAEDSKTDSEIREVNHALDTEFQMVFLVDIVDVMKENFDKLKRGMK